MKKNIQLIKGLQNWANMAHFYARYTDRTIKSYTKTMPKK
jgi:hypothetical protein